MNIINTINRKLAGHTHPLNSSICYMWLTIYLNGTRTCLVSAIFPSYYDVQLPSSMYCNSDGIQFRYCNHKLKAAISDPYIRSQFTAEQVLDIQAGRTPRDCTWHHSPFPGLMQLVDKQTHNLCRHTGGRAIWGGGRSCR